MLQKLALVCALGFAIGACGGSKDSDEALLDETVSLMEGMAKAIESADGDCGKMAANLESFVSSKGERMKELKEKAKGMKADKEKSEKMKQLSEKYKGRMEKAMPAMMGMMKCSEDPKMKAMEEKLRGIM